MAFVKYCSGPRAVGNIYARHFGHHDHYQLQQQDRGQEHWLINQLCNKLFVIFASFILVISGPVSNNFSLSAGISAVMSQLQLVCAEEKQFRALNLDITCPDTHPELTQCHCLTKDKYGKLVSRVEGKKDYDVSLTNVLFSKAYHWSYIRIFLMCGNKRQ